MSETELLARAVEFDAGALPVVGDWIVPEDREADFPGHRMTVVKHGGGWCVTGEPMMHLTADGEWVFPTLAHHFATPSEAMDFAMKWKAERRAKAEADPWTRVWSPTS